MALKRTLTMALVSGLLLLVAAPAFAKGDFEFIISGGDLSHPVRVSSAYVYSNVHGMLWSPSSSALALHCPLYRMDFYGIDSGRRHFEQRWWYCSSAGGALLEAPAGQVDGKLVRWETFSPAFQRLIDNAIHPKPHVLGLPIVLLVVGLLIAAVFGAVRWLDRRFPIAMPRQAA